MYRNSIVGRSNKISNYASNVIDETPLVKPKEIVKSAKAIPVFDRKKFSESQKFLQECKSYGLGMYQASNGSVWAIEKDANDEPWLVRNEELTKENNLVDEIVKECRNKEAAKSANFF